MELILPLAVCHCISLFLVLLWYYVSWQIETYLNDLHIKQATIFLFLQLFWDFMLDW